MIAAPGLAPLAPTTPLAPDATAVPAAAPFHALLASLTLTLPEPVAAVAALAPLAPASAVAPLTPPSRTADAIVAAMPYDRDDPAAATPADDAADPADAATPEATEGDGLAVSTVTVPVAALAVVAPIPAPPTPAGPATDPIATAIPSRASATTAADRARPALPSEATFGRNATMPAGVASADGKGAAGPAARDPAAIAGATAATIAPETADSAAAPSNPAYRAAGAAARMAPTVAAAPAAPLVVTQRTTVASAGPVETHVEAAFVAARRVDPGALPLAAATGMTDRAAAAAGAIAASTPLPAPAKAVDPRAPQPSGAPPIAVATVVGEVPARFAEASPASPDAADRAAPHEDTAPARPAALASPGPMATIPGEVRALQVPQAARSAGPPVAAAPVEDAASIDASPLDLAAIFPLTADAPLTVAFTRPVAAALPVPVAFVPMAVVASATEGGLADRPPAEDGMAVASPQIAAATLVPPTQPTPAAADPSAVSAPAAPAEVSIQHHLDVAHDGAWLDRLARDIAASADHESRMRFQLNPERLGALHVEIAQNGDGASVRFAAESEAARALIADAQPRLIAEARAQGMRITDTQVDLSNQGGADQHGASANAFAQQQQQQQQQSAAQRAPAYDRPATAMTRPASAGPAERAAARAERYA